MGPEVEVLARDTRGRPTAAEGDWVLLRPAPEGPSPRAFATDPGQ